MEKEKKKYDYANTYDFRKGFEEGYNKAKEKYSLSNIIDLYIKETGCGMDMWSKEENETMTTIAKIIESLLQPKTPTQFEFEIERALQMRKEEIKNAQMDMFHHFDNLPYGFTYFKELHKAEDFADNYKTFGGNNE